DAREAAGDLAELLLGRQAAVRELAHVEGEADAAQRIDRLTRLSLFSTIVERDHPEPAAVEDVVQGPLVPAGREAELLVLPQRVVVGADALEMGEDGARLGAQPGGRLAQIQLVGEQRAVARAVDQEAGVELFAPAGAQDDAVVADLQVRDVGLLMVDGAMPDGGVDHVEVDVLPVEMALREERSGRRDEKMGLRRVLALAVLMVEEADG